MSSHPDVGRAAPTARSAGAQADVERVSARLGRDFVFSFHAALRALKLYPLENQAVQNALDELRALASELALREGGLTLRYVGDFCFINDLRLRIDLSNYATFGSVGRTLKAHEVGQLETDGEATVREWTALLSLLLDEPPPEKPFEKFRARLEESRVLHLRVSATADAPVEPRSAEVRAAARRTYAESVAVARDALLGLRMGKGVSVRRVKRSVQRIVDEVLNNESSIMGMTVLRDYDQYTFAHSVNVSIFSIALGKKLGLTKQELYELGFGALMHDLGKVKLPIELTSKQGHLEEADWEKIREHPCEGLLALLEMSSAGDLPLRAILMAYEHHMKMDLSGYPRCVRPRTPTLFSRIVAVADGFDAATTKRSYQSQPWLPDAVLREMRDNPARGFDPLLVKAFISMTGYYPIGSLVILDTFELAVVIEASGRPDAHHLPVVRVIFDEMGIPVAPPRTVDLSERDAKSGQPLRSIIKTTDPQRYGIDVRDYVG